MNDLLKLRVKKIVRETDDTFTYVLESADETTITYHAGQFLTLLFRFREREVRRSFSLISSPSVDESLAITIKRLENGELSRYLMDHLKIGDIIQSLYPAGRFTVNTNYKNKLTYFFIAAGSGITPVYSLIKTILLEEPNSLINLIYSNASERTTIFYEPLKNLAEKFPSRLQCIFLFSQYGQRLNNSMLEKLVNENLRSGKDETEFYICGPSGYMRMIMLTLIFMGFRKEHVHKENFISEQLPAAESFVPRNTSSHIIQILYNNNTYQVSVPPFKTILDAALAQNISLPYSCKTGLCSTCAAICKKGKVDMTNNEVLTDKDLSQGWILTCTGFPLEDGTEIEFRKEKIGNSVNAQ